MGRVRRIVLIHKRAPGDTAVLTALPRDIHAAYPGYSVNGVISTAVIGGTKYGIDFITIQEIDNNGGITAITIWDNAQYYKSTGIIDRVEIDHSGQYYSTDGSIESVEITTPGRLSGWSEREVIRGTVSLTTIPVWFAEDCV